MLIALVIATVAAAALTQAGGITQTTSATQAEEQRVLAAEDAYVAAEVERDEACRSPRRELHLAQSYHAYHCCRWAGSE